MNKSTLLCGLTCFGLMLTVMPPVGVAAEKFECPLPVKPTTPAKLQEIQRLPDVVAVLNETASKQGLSGAAWIAMTVENALQR